MSTRYYETSCLIIGSGIAGLAAAIALVFIGLAAQRAAPAVIEELQANRPVWSAILAMSNWDALLMRFPDAQNQ